MEYRPYQDYDLPLLYFGDFHSARKEEQNKFLLDVSVFLVYLYHGWFSLTNHVAVLEVSISDRHLVGGIYLDRHLQYL